GGGGRARGGGAGWGADGGRVPVRPEGRGLCEVFGLDPPGTIASGSLLMTVAPGDAEAVPGACRVAGIDCAAIGRVTPASEGVALVSGGHPRPMPAFPQDEITRIFGGSA